jgi:hypothetical protein
VTERLLLDTHVVLWLDSDDQRLSPATHALIDSLWQTGGTIYLSAVTAWEIALLVDTGRIELDLTARRGSSGFSTVPASRPCRSGTAPPAAPTSCLILSTAIRPIGC